MRISEPILIAANTPYDPGPFKRRTHAKVGVIYYSDAAGSTGSKLLEAAGGERDGTYVLVEMMSASGSSVTPYLDTEAKVGGTGLTAILLPGDKTETIQELGGMSRIEVTAAQQGPPNDAAGAVSYRIWVDVEPAP